MEKKKYESVLHYTFIILIVVVFLYLVLGEVFLPADKWGDSNHFEAYQGSQKGIWYYYGMEVLLACLMFAFGFLAVAASLILRFCFHQKTALEYPGMGVLAAGMLLLATSVFRQILFPNLSVVNDVAVCIIMLLPFPYLVYIDEVQKGRYHFVYTIMKFLAVTDFLICTLLHILKIADYTDTITYIIVVCAVITGSMAVGTGIDIFKGYIREYRIVFWGLLVAFFFAVIQILVFYRRTMMFQGAFMAAGLLLLLLFAFISTIMDMVRLESEKTQAVLANESKGRFLANMSHEIRTPINAVLGMDAVILRETTEPEIKEYAMDIQHAGQTLLSLVNDILDLSKIESGKMEITLVDYDLAGLLTDVMNMISLKVKQHDLRIKLRADRKLPSGLYGDDIRLRQVLVNMMKNAVKYTERGSVTLDVRGEEIQENRIKLEFAVIDTGMGIKPEDMEKIFSEFEGTGEAQTRYVEGTGLGMSITSSLLKMMGSELKVESDYGKGSTFYFELEQEITDGKPIGNLESRMESQAEDYEYSVAFRAPDARILIVDDNAMNRKVFRKLLKETMVQMDEADSGFQCLQMIKKKPYDLIFLDHMMPEMDGIETFHRMQEDGEHLCRHTPVIVLTANAVSGAREMYLAEGFMDYISKPVEPEKLEQAIMEMIPEEKIIRDFKPVRTEDDNTDKKAGDIAFPKIPGIEWDIALKKMKNQALLMETAEDFYELNEAEALTLERLAQQIPSGGGDALEHFRIKVHSMKSSSALIGAMEVSETAKSLEIAAGEEDVEYIKKTTPPFLTAWRRLKLDMQVMFPEENRVKRAPDYFKLMEYLQLLKDAISDMDIDTSDEIIRQLKSVRYTEEEERLVEEISLAVSEIDEEKTIELAERLEDIAAEHLAG